MSVTSLFIFFGEGWCLVIAVFGWQPGYLKGASADAFSARKLLEYWHLLPTQSFNPWTLALAWPFGLGATVAPLGCLRRLGKTLYLQAPLGFAGTSRFRWLGHARSANIILGVAAG